ncbi:hypothetical protein AAFF_G00206830 [Aldrovandia affinis]|uniref:Uncharacterized protein n=1 Tax=Aldrovandia affinis TaxID=143900 RepID=A0AAD7QZZ6_9TELE|nr:hypothetical protein AAFF_G00206830 [Aldrovandia affinis]
MGLTGSGDGPKADLGASSAELVYGQPLHAPGSFYLAVRCLGQPRASSVLRDGLKSFAPVPTTHHGLPGPTLIQVWAEARLCLCAKISIVALCSLSTRDHFE